MGTQFINYVSIDILPTYYPNKEEIANPTLYANNVQKLMAEHLGYKCSPHTMADMAMLCKAMSKHMPVQKFEFWQKKTK